MSYFNKIGVSENMGASEMMELFAEVFGAEAAKANLRLFFAPGRVNLMGEHVDYNGGHVLPCALSMGTYLLAAPRTDGLCRLFSVNFKSAGVSEFDLAHPWDPMDTSWSRYPRAVLSVLSETRRPPRVGLDVLYHGTIPGGAGLSSSASIEMATALAFLSFSGIDPDLKALAVLARKAENEKVGVKCGVMDQFAVTLARRDQALLLDCQTLDYSLCDLKMPGAKFLITNSNKPHALSASGYNERFEQCQAALSILGEAMGIEFLCQLGPEDLEESCRLLNDNILARRVRHVASENARTLKAAIALAEGGLEELGRLMNESHASMRDDYEISCREMDALTDISRSAEGVYGSRMTGGGFGGCSVTLVREEAAENFKKEVGEAYAAAIGYAPTFYDAETSNGVRELKFTRPRS